MSKLGGKSDLASAKAEIDKIYVGKLKTVPIDLSKLSSFSYARNAIFICIFWKKIIFSFLTEGQFHVCRKKKHHLYRIYRKHIYLYFFWEKSSFTFRLEKISSFQEKEMPPFLMLQERSYFSMIFLERPFFRTFEEYIIFPCIFWEGSPFIFHLKNKSYFRRKVISSIKISFDKK